MKNIILLILALQIASITKAQTFEKIIKNPNDEIVYDAVLIEEPYVLFAYNYGETDYDYNAKVFKMNYYTGEIINSVDIDISSYNEYRFNSIGNILNFHDTCFILLCSVINKNTDDRQLYICHLNSDLEKTFDTISGHIDKSDFSFDRKIIHMIIL